MAERVRGNRLVAFRALVLVNIFDSEGNVLRVPEKGWRMGKGLRLLRGQSHAIEDRLDSFILCDEGEDLDLGPTESAQQGSIS